MKLISWNVNGLRACMKKGFADFFREQDADIFAIQETKMQPEQMEEAMEFEGYHRYMNSAERKGYSGTLVYTKTEPLSVSYEIEGDVTKEGRVITLEYPDFWFVCAYVPNSKEGLLRLPYRCEWEDMLRAHLKKLDETKPVIYTGDLNVAHEEIDIRNPDSNHKSAGFSDEERAKMSELLDAGFADTFREKYPETVKYSWWSYRFNARAKGIGWRIDYFLVSDRIMDRVNDSMIFDDVTGSDHCPVGLDIQF
ncbi:MAG: exodeoxyribonuclease III [Solobacterium sp.]|nr:exodeoxyribonuclease III [Solobacterium sp.]MBQ9823879.1 exodeoxyribonuclease III [Solobacterium sp.]